MIDPRFVLTLATGLLLLLSGLNAGRTQPTPDSSDSPVGADGDSATGVAPAAPHA